MTPKKIWANLVVSDLDRTMRFYSELGFKANGRSGDLTSFLFGSGNYVIHFFLKEVFTNNVKAEFVDAQKENEVVFTLSAATRDEVDQWSKEVEKAGGNIITPPEEFGKGYYGFLFADPDGHKFNVFYM